MVCTFLNENLDYSNAYQHISKGLSFFHCSPSKFQSARGKTFSKSYRDSGFKSEIIERIGTANNFV